MLRLEQLACVEGEFYCKRMMVLGECHTIRNTFGIFDTQFDKPSSTSYIVCNATRMDEPPFHFPRIGTEEAPMPTSDLIDSTFSYVPTAMPF